MKTVSGLIMLILLLVIIGPFCTIWSLNTLFPSLTISYDFDHWLAVVILGSALKSTTYNKG
jgi:hypothetical protein